MNFIQIAGHLGTDAEVRFTAKGQKVINLRVATNSFKAGKEETIWWRVTLWGDRFDKILPYLKKGSAVMIYGELSKPEIYVDKEGRSQVSLEITAECVRFSPFGKTDRSSQDQTTSHQGHQRDQGFGEQTFSGSGSYESAHSYGGAQNNANMEEEPLPF